MMAQLPDTSTAQTHYEVLQVPPDASYATIKNEFHRLARLYHPDRSRPNNDDGNNNHVIYEKIQQAWECLQNVQRRKMYDHDLKLAMLKQMSKRQDATVLVLDDFRHNEGNENDEGLVYTCRCGTELDVTVIWLDDNDMMECPSCSLRYDTSALWEENL